MTQTGISKNLQKLIEILTDKDADLSDVDSLGEFESDDSDSSEENDAAQLPDKSLNCGAESGLDEESCGNQKEDPTEDQDELSDQAEKNK